MIQDINAAKLFVTSFREIADIDSLGREKVSEFEDLIETAFSAKVPGAIVARPRPHDATIYYVITQNQQDWHRIRPLLNAYAGPTVSTFNGCPEPLDSSDPVEAFLLSGGWAVTTKFVSGLDPFVGRMNHKSLTRMVMTLKMAPTTTLEVPQSTSRLISRFVDALNVGNRIAAENFLNVLKEEYRVDALNLSFLRVQLYAHFAEWNAILEMPEFASLCYARRPSKITIALLDSLYQVYMRQDDHDDIEFERSRVRWATEVRQYVRPLLRLPIPEVVSAGALRLYAWECLTSEARRLDIEDAILAQKELLGPLTNRLVEAGRSGSHVNSDSLNDAEDNQSGSLAVAQQALAKSEVDDTLASIRQAFSRLAELDESARKELFLFEPFRAYWKNVESETGEESPPTNWNEWFQRLPNPAFKSSFSILERAVVEWPAYSIVDPVAIHLFADDLNRVPYALPSNERLADALPLLVGWISEDPQFPRASMMPVYEGLLLRLVLGSRRGSPIFESSSILIRALLTLGMSSATYGTLLDDCLDLLGSGLGVRNVYWISDILEETINNQAPDASKREAFWHQTYMRLYPLFAYLTPGQRVVVARLCVSLGWKVSDQLLSSHGDALPENSQFKDRLNGLSIAIYTLTESASRQAEQALLTIQPSIKVAISTDYGGTPSLKSMVQNSDIVVVATASAKHAATEFIQQMRPRNMPILYAAGRGFSSIVRAVEDYVMNSHIRKSDKAAV